MNPPYGIETPKWMAKLAGHGNGIALIFARTETHMFFDYVWDCASAVLFLKGRVQFRTVDGAKVWNAGAPSVLIAYGESNAQRLQSCGLAGKYIQLKKSIDLASHFCDSRGE